jgi:hypothetical protein
MIRRWLIRGLALALLTLCVMAWVGSYFTRVSVRLQPHGWHITLLIDSGSARCEVDHVPQYIAREWVWTLRPPDFMLIEFDYSRAKYHIGGFAYRSDSATWLAGFTTNLSWIIFPVWFPTLLSALALWLVWRKTRPAYNGRGFSVEVAGKEATKP